MFRRGRPSTAPHTAPPGTKWCKRGQHFVAEDQFSKIQGGRYLAAYCKTCRNNIRKQQGRPAQKYRILRQRVLDQYGHKCRDCGEADDTVLQVHHAQFNRQEQEQRGWSNSMWYRDALKNPQDYALFCRNCHWKRHIGHKKTKRTSAP